MAAPPPAIDWRPATIVVSGYTPVPAATAYVAGHAVVTATHHAAVDLAPPQPLKARCGVCRVWWSPHSLADARLGFTGWCTPHVEAGLRYARRRHGRTPGPGEFYCPQCAGIYPVAAMTPPDYDGRRRLVCVTCRRWQWSVKRARVAHRPIPPRPRSK